MSNNNATYVEDSAFPTITNFSHVNEKISENNYSNINNPPTATNYGNTQPAIPLADEYYDVAGSLFNQRLILPKELKSPFDIRYKTDYFPRGGKNANKSQSPRYVLTVDGKQDIIIKFPLGYQVPKTSGNYCLEIALTTVPRVNQHHLHVNKFQLDHKDVNVMDQNPFFIFLTPEHYEKGEIAVKLVLIKTPMNDLKNISSLPLFDNQAPSGWASDCKTVADLEHTYELSHARIAFSLGYVNANDQFVRFFNTTVMSNEIEEKEKPKPSDMTTCPNCSHSYSIKEEKQKVKKRSASSSNSTNKKRRSKQTNEITEPKGLIRLTKIQKG